MAELELDLLIPAGRVTYLKASTAIDLVWGNDETKNQIIKCQIAEKNDHGSDHLPIETIIATETEPPKSSPSYNYSKTNWQELSNELKTNLPELPNVSKDLTTQAKADNYTKRLVQATNKA